MKEFRQGSHSDRYETFLMKTRNLSRPTINVTKNKKNIVAGNEKSKCDQKYLQEDVFSFIPVSC